MKITKITILKFMGISEFKTARVGKINRIQGGNGVGKSSILKAITEAMKSSGKDPFLVEKGADRSQILIELDGDIQVERTITPTSNDVRVTMEGKEVDRPANFLKAILGPTAFNFDPTQFLLLKGRERTEMFLKSIWFTVPKPSLEKILYDLGWQTPDDAGIKLESYDYEQHGLTVLKKVQSDVYNRRHEVNLEVTRLTKAIEQDSRDIPETVNPEEFKGFDLQAELAQLGKETALINQHEADKRSLETKRQRATQIISEIDDLERRLAEKREELSRLRDEGKSLADKVKEFVAPDVAARQSRINRYNQSQKLLLKLEEIEKRKEALAEKKEEHQSLDDLYVSLTTTVPKRLLSQVKLPVNNLEIRDEEIFLDGVPADKLSDSEKVVFAVDIARKLAEAGKLRVICIDGYEKLDADKKKIFEETCKDDGFEYFITEVTSGPLKVTAEEETADKRDEKKKVSRLQTSPSGSAGKAPGPAVRSNEAGF
ncbi:MAG: hypothetical protein AB1690_02575 [Candidatus Zixiibacteriota bacterium]